MNNEQDYNFNDGFWLSSNIAVSTNLKSIFAFDSGVLYEDDLRLRPKQIGDYLVAPWGIDNDLPRAVINKVAKSEIVGANCDFNRNVCFGLGPKLVKLIRDDSNKVVDYYEITEGREFDFFDRNDISMYLMESFTDMAYFNNAFTELIPDQNFKEIYTIRNKEAVFSRWGLLKSGEIKWHLYSAKWDQNANKKDITASYVLNEFDVYNDITIQLAKNNKRMIYPVYMPSPGHPYYSLPNWYSIFFSGWYEQNISIPEIKSAILQNNLGVKNIIYISKKLLSERCRSAQISPNDRDGIEKVKQEIVKEFNEVLSGSTNYGKTITALKDLIPSGNSVHEEKYITVEQIKNEINGGELIADVESSANIICYAMGVHPSLIGATPGKNSGSLGGTDKRELFLMKQALMKPVVDRVMRPLSIVKKINKWDKNIAITIPEYIFTTLDQNKKGKQESTTNIAQ